MIMTKMFGKFAGTTLFAAMMWCGVSELSACSQNKYANDCNAVEVCTWTSKIKRCSGTPTAPAAELEYGTNAHVDLCATKKNKAVCERSNSDKCSWDNNSNECVPECLMLDSEQCESSEVKIVDRVTRARKTGPFCKFDPRRKTCFRNS
jgi:hypothetical protein